MANIFSDVKKTFGIAGDYYESKRPSYREKNTEDGIRHVSAIEGIIAGIWAIYKLAKTLFNKN